MGAKKIIICCDGTWNNPEQKEVTNVVKVARALRPLGSGNMPQVVFYDWGVGSEGGIGKLTGGVAGKGIDKNIQDAYRFLVHNYREGDEIYFLGFSRGAYTARSTVGLIRNVGVLKKEFAKLIPRAYRMYRSKAGPDVAAARRFRRDYSREVRIAFIGVWDTVGALGIPLKVVRDLVTPGKYTFHDTRLSRIVDCAAHAVAVDERRVDFKPALWHRRPTPDLVLEQQWFAGVHCDVGGGYRETGLSDIALMWLVEQAERAGLVFDRDYLDKISHPDALGKLHRSYRGIYWAKKPYLRPIGKLGEELEKIHPSVRQRMAALENYRPKNVIKLEVRG